MKLFVLEMVAPYPGLRQRLVRAYRFIIRLLRPRLKTPMPLKWALLLAYWGMVVPAKWLGCSPHHAFSASRKSGWQPCHIASDTHDYTDPYRVGEALRPSLYVRLVQIKLRALRIIAPKPEPDAARPPSDIYALF